VSAKSQANIGPDPTPIIRLSTAYWDAQVLLTANRIGVFDACADASMTVEAVAEVIETRPRPTRLLLKSCVGLGLLIEDENGFRNAPLAAAYLTKNSPAYMGNAIRYSDNLYGTWGQLEQALREDRPMMAPETYLGDDPGKTRDFVYGMHDRALGIGRALVEMVDLSGRRRLLDIGGGPGTYSALLAQRYPEVRSQVLELPEVAEIATEILESMGCRDRVKLLPGSYHTSTFPGDNDAVLISGVFHRETAETCRGLIERARDSPVDGGLLIISDVFTDAGGSHPVFAALFGINMLLTAADGGVHEDRQVAEWMSEAGFKTPDIQAFPPPLPHRVVMAVKA
jgi:hypothetical protein